MLLFGVCCSSSSTPGYNPFNTDSSSSNSGSCSPEIAPSSVIIPESPEIAPSSASAPESASFSAEMAPSYASAPESASISPSSVSAASCVSHSRSVNKLCL